MSIIYSRDRPHTTLYLEGSDATGKDSVASIIADEVPSTIVSAEYRTARGRTVLEEWSMRYPELNHSGRLLAAAVLDLALCETPCSPIPSIQISHNLIRGGAYVSAFNLPFGELYDDAQHMVPGLMLPVALTADIDTIRSRVQNNPDATEFDFLAFKDPARVEKIVDYISARCTLLGGMTIDTSHLTKDEVAARVKKFWVDTSARQQNTHDMTAYAQELATSIAAYDPAFKPLVGDMRTKLYARQ